jgi:hypothetical protein
MPDLPQMPANANTELVENKAQAANIDMEALAEKIVALLRREAELDAERNANSLTNR